MKPMKLGAALLLVTLCLAPREVRSEASTSVLVMLDPAGRGALATALARELQERRVRVYATDAPPGLTALDRQEAAQFASDAVGAIAAVWVEHQQFPSGEDSWVLRVVASPSESIARYAPLATAPLEVEPSVFAVATVSLLEELLLLPQAVDASSELEPWDPDVPVIPLRRRGEAPQPADRAERPRRERRRDFLELALEVDSHWRNFSVPINPSCDPSGRNQAALSTGSFPELGARLDFYPGRLATDRWYANFGLEFAFHHHLALHVLNRRSGDEVDAEQYSLNLGLNYRHNFGSERAGVVLWARFGYNRYSFFLGDLGNDTVPPFTYDALYFGLKAHIPLGTEYIGLDLGLQYHLVLSVGDEAVAAYNASGEMPDAVGFLFSGGLSGRIVAGLRWRLGLEALGVNSDHSGKGRGFGTDPSTACEGDCLAFAGCVDTTSPFREPVIGGIATTGSALDRSFRLVIQLSYVFGRRVAP